VVTAPFKIGRRAQPCRCRPDARHAWPPGCDVFGSVLHIRASQLTEAMDPPVAATPLISVSVSSVDPAPLPARRHGSTPLGPRAVFNYVGKPSLARMGDIRRSPFAPCRVRWSTQCGRPPFFSPCIDPGSSLSKKCTSPAMRMPESRAFARFSFLPLPKCLQAFSRE